MIPTKMTRWSLRRYYLLISPRFAFDNHSMYNVWYENELVGWIMMAYTLLQNSSVSYSLIGRCKCCLNSIGRASAVSAGVCRSAASHCALRGDGRAKRSWFHRFEMKLLFKFIQSSKTSSSLPGTRRLFLSGANAGGKWRRGKRANGQRVNGQTKSRPAKSVCPFTTW